MQNEVKPDTWPIPGGQLEQLEQLIADLHSANDELQAAFRAHTGEVERFSTPPRIAKSWCRLLTALARHSALTIEAARGL